MSKATKAKRGASTRGLVKHRDTAPKLGDAPSVLPVADVEDRPPPTDRDLARVVVMAQYQQRLVDYVLRIEDQLARANSALKQVNEVDLPEAMQRIGMKKFELVTGAVIDVVESVHVSIPKPRVEEAHKFLEEHEAGGLIKRAITVLFGRDDIKWAEKFLSDCRKRKKALDLSVDAWVEPQTLLAWARRRVAEARETGANVEDLVPQALFGRYERTSARIVVPKG